MTWSAVDISLLLSEVLSTANALKTLGSTWYKDSEGWDNFPRQLALLRNNCGFWQNQMRRSSDLDAKSTGDRIVSPLLEVKKLLNEEEAKIRGSKTKQAVFARFAGWIWKINFKAAFPAVLGQSIAKLTEAFEEDVLETLDFHEDERYVCLGETEDKVCKALERSGPGLVLLCGGVGTGKSSLARNLALKVHASRRNVNSSHSLGSDNLAWGSHAFDLAAFLNCSVGCDLEAKQREVRACLGLDNRGGEELPPEYVGADEGELVKQYPRSLDADYPAERPTTSRTTTKAGSSCSRVQIPTDKKLLIILDDVRDAEFLQGIITLSSRNVNCKLLVTSVMGDLCQGLNLTQTHLSVIYMECIKQDDARNILVSHIPCSTSYKFRIARHDFKANLNTIIEKTGANPLAMASIAGTIDENTYEEKEAWDKAADDVSLLLGRNYSASIHQKKYAKSFWEALQEILVHLRHESKSLLVLTAACKGPATRESVIEFFWRTLFPSSSRSFFIKARRQLESRQLITMIKAGPDTNLDDLNAPKEVSWSIHILVQRFINERRGPNDTSLSAMMEAAMDKLVDTLANNDPGVQEQGLHFLTTLAKGNDAMRFKVAKSRHMLEESVKALNGKSSGNTQELVASIFAILAEGDDDMRMKIVNFPNALEELVKAIIAEMQIPKNSTGYPKGGTNAGGQKDAPEGLQRQAACVLANLAKGDDYIKWRIVLCPGLLEALVNSMVRVQSLFDAQKQISWVLINLAEGSHELKLGIVEFPGLLEALANALTEKCTYAEHAARVLANLAEGGQEIKSKLVNHPRVLEELINGMTEYHAGFREQATVALANLANGEDAIKLKIVRVPRALENVVTVVNEADYCSVQLNATRILANLAKGDYDTKMRIVEQNGAFEQLVSAMAKEEDSSVQLNAIMTLANLIAFDSKGHQALAIKSKIVRSSRAVVALGRGLGNGNSPDIQAHSGRALDNLIAISKENG